MRSFLGAAILVAAAIGPGAGLGICQSKTPPRDATAAPAEGKANLRGRVTPRSQFGHFRFQASLWNPAEEHHTALPLDEQGRFSVTNVAAGRHEIWVTRTPAWSSDTPVRDPRPMLGWAELGKQQFTERTPIELRPGTVTEFEAPAPWLTWIEGRVTCAGKPAANIRVFAGRTDAHFLHCYHPDFYRQAKRATGQDGIQTDGDGRFRFGIVGPGEWNFHARAENSPHTTPPITIKVSPQQVGTKLELPPLEIAIGAHSVTGKLALGIKRKPSEFAEDTARDIWLFPAEIAHLDPWDWVDRFGYWTFHHERQPSDDRPFRFDHVPAGTWVLCAGNRRTRMEVQQVVEVPKGEPGEHRLIALGDVGPMDRRAEISADLAYTIDHVPVAGRSSLAIRRVLPNGLRLYTTSAETPERLFEYRPRIGPFTLEHFTAGHRLRGDGTARLRLAPGRYEAEISSYTASIHSTLIWSGIRTRFTVAADGTTTPAKLKF